MAEPGQDEAYAPVEDQTDQTLAALTLVIAESVLQGAHARDDRSNPALWAGLLGVGAVPVLSRYLLVTSGLFVASTGRNPAEYTGEVRQAVRVATEAAVDRASQVLASRVPDSQALPVMEEASQARTDAAEAARSMVVGSREMARFDISGVLGAVYKVWHTRVDSKVRPTHAGLEGNRVPLVNPFVTLAGNSIMYPHDPSAPLAETAGCRCGLAYIVPRGTP